MALFRARHLLILLFAVFVNAKPKDMIVVTDSTLVKALRVMSNETKAAETLNLPANASSIRENITDTFSCENRTYGYYADVDNDCQVFHVCLPSQAPSGRNVTYRWSFICPNETVFNQEVLTCTRTLDSIKCEDSPMLYHLNMEIGKEPEKTEEPKKEKRIHKRKEDKRKENMVMDNFIMGEVIKDLVYDELNERRQAIELHGNTRAEGPMLIEGVIEDSDSEMEEIEREQRKEEEMDRKIMETNMRNARQMKRGSYRFRADVN